MPYKTGRVNQAEWLLRAAFVLVPILAGADKLAHLATGAHFLTDWHQYLAPQVVGLLPVEPHAFLYAVGAIEVAAGLVVLFAPRLGGWIVGAWLLGITGNLLLTPEHLDIALRDFGLALAALAMARLSSAYVTF